MKAIAFIPAIIHAFSFGIICTMHCHSKCTVTVDTIDIRNRHFCSYKINRLDIARDAKKDCMVVLERCCLHNLLWQRR